MTIGNTTLVENYKLALKSFPWDDDRSDDFRVWKAWSLKKWELISMQKTYDKDYKIWNEIAPEHQRVWVSNESSKA